MRVRGAPIYVGRTGTTGRGAGGCRRVRPHIGICKALAHLSVGWHADQLTYLGPYCTIASLSLGTPRAFRLRETDTVDAAYKSGKPIRTYEVNLGHNSLVLMNAGCQERFKHTCVDWLSIQSFLR
jgi:hypothetical protein